MEKIFIKGFVLIVKLYVVSHAEYENTFFLWKIKSAHDKNNVDSLYKLICYYS